jgi:hypothetical protein
MKHFNIFRQLLLSVLLVSAFSPQSNAQLSGNYVVGPTGTYLTLADAVSDLLIQGVSGPTNFLIQSGTYNGSSWQGAISSISGADNSKRVTFTAQTGVASDVVLQYSASTSASNYIFLLNTSFVTIKNLTLQAQGTTYGTAIQVAGTSSNDSVVGCTISSPTTTATGVDMAVIAMGGAAPLAGVSNVIYGNTINNGSVSVWLAGSSSATTNNHVIDNNTSNNPAFYGVFANYTNNLKLRNNIVNQNTTVNNSAGFYLQNSGTGLDVLNNTITVNTTTNFHYGIYNASINPGTATVDANYFNNTVRVTVTTGSAQALYNQFSARLNINGNNFRSVANGSGGNAIPPTLMYSCTNSKAENNTFSAIGGAAGANVANNAYYFMTLANGCSVRLNTFNDSTTTGTIFGNGYFLLDNSVNSNCNRNTFNIYSTTGSIFAAASGYNWLVAANGSSIDSNVFLITNTTGQIGTTSSSSTAYGFNNNQAAGTTVSMSYNRFNITSSNASTSYGLWGYYPSYNVGAGAIVLVNNDTFNITFNSANTFYMWGYYGGLSGYPNGNNPGPTYKMNNWVVNYNAPNGTGTFLTMGYYYSGGYYTTNSEMNNGTFNYTTTSSSFLSHLGYYYTFGYYSTNAQYNKNKITMNATSGTIYPGGYYPLSYYTQNLTSDSNTYLYNVNGVALYEGYYRGYYNTNFKYRYNNHTINNSTGTTYAGYLNGYYSMSGTQFNNNNYTVNATTGQVYNPYSMSYYSQGAGMYKNNTFLSNVTSSGSIYSPYMFTYQGSTDTIDANTYTGTSNGGYIYINTGGYTKGLIQNNLLTMNTTSGYIYNYTGYYSYGGIMRQNTYNLNTTTGGIYGLYDYYSGGTGNVIQNNKFNLKSTGGGPVYGYYSGAPGGNSYIGNLITTQTTGTSQLFYSSGSFQGPGDAMFVNNTFHSNGTNTASNYLVQHLATGSYKSRFYNNIFSSMNAVTGSALQFNDTARFMNDYNLVWVPGTLTISCTTPSVTATSLQQWRSTTKRDMNSLVYDPGFMDPSNLDLRPNPANSNSWSVNGRGMHFAGDTLDINLNVRPKALKDGVPDLGAYEFTPASTPPDAVPSPAIPAINTRQVFTFGGDTVCAVDWGLSVPSTASVKQYTGTKAAFNPPLLSTTERMFAYVNLNTPAGVFDYNAKFYYKDPWRGDIPSETLSKFAKSVAGATWEGYNFTNGVSDSVMNILSKKDNLDSLPIAMTGVRNARIGIRCINAPTGLGHANVIADQADEFWDAEFNAQYQIFADFSKLTPTTVPGSAVIVSTNSHHFSGLTEDKTYYVHLRTICGPKDTSGWSLDSFHTMITCHAPNLQLTSLSATRAVVYWDTIKTASSYEYVLDQSPNDPNFGTYTLSRSVLCDFLKTGTTYYFHARTRCYTIYNISGWATLQFTPVGIDQLPGSGKGITAYPNPVKDMLIINVAGKLGTDAVITISDVTGKAVRNINVTSNKTEVDMRNLPAGMYVIKYSDKERIEVTKVNKE